jgi:hypothetical protein
MQSERTGAPREGAAPLDVAAADDQVDCTILALLQTSQFPGLWSVDELKREIGKPTDVIDAIDRLHGQGLIHRLDEFVFITHAAACYEELRL